MAPCLSQSPMIQSQMNEKVQISHQILLTTTPSDWNLNSFPLFLAVLTEGVTRFELLLFCPQYHPHLTSFFVIRGIEKVSNLTHALFTKVTLETYRYFLQSPKHFMQKDLHQT
jgi:hypothetical protein